MKACQSTIVVDALESRRLFAWSAYAQLVNQDDAASQFASVTGAGVTVAIIDTGIDYTHPSLGGGFGKNSKVIGGYDFVDNDGDPMDEDGHGTAVAGVVAADPYTVNGVTYQGVAPGAKLVGLRVGDADSISDNNIEKALNWIITNYKSFGISVINLSLGSGNYTDGEISPQLSNEFTALHNLGIFVTAASGNSNDQNSGPISQDGIAYPAADSDVFAVGAVTSGDVITSWTQRGDELDLLAPGDNIVMPQPGGGFVTEDGTSFASPHVAGTAALIKQADPKAGAGDIGSILLASGKSNRDGDNEAGDTTGLLFSRLDIASALSLTGKRSGKTRALALGSAFDTALDSEGVLHAAFYNAKTRDLMYATRSTAGLWSSVQIVDSAGDVGAQLSIAVDNSGKVGIGYFDSTNTGVKYAGFNGAGFSIQRVESDKIVGNSPSLGFAIDGNAYLAYYRRTGGYLKLATLDRDTGGWTRATVDGGSANVGTILDLDVGEAALRSGLFTQYDTTVAIAYADQTNGDLKYARLDVDDAAAEWFMAVVDDTTGVGSIDLDLHAGPTNAGLQAQIAYQDVANQDVMYAYRNTDWFTETAASSGVLGKTVQLSFTGNDQPMVTYFHNGKKAIYTSTRQSATNWTTEFNNVGSYTISVSLNDRSGEILLSYLNRARSSVLSELL